MMMIIIKITKKKIFILVPFSVKKKKKKKGKTAYLSIRIGRGRLCRLYSKIQLNTPPRVYNIF